MFTQDISQQRVATLLQSLYQAHLIPAAIASYRIPRLVDNKNDGELTLGALDLKYYNASTLVTKSNVNKFGYWGVAVDAVKVGKENMHWSNRTIVVDTGTVCELLLKGIFLLIVSLSSQTLIIAPKDVGPRLAPALLYSFADLLRFIGRRHHSWLNPRIFFRRKWLERTMQHDHSHFTNYRRTCILN
jgi:hypothetical protein